MFKIGIRQEYFPGPGRGYVFDDMNYDIAPHRPYHCSIGRGYAMDDINRDIAPPLPLLDRILPILHFKVHQGKRHTAAHAVSRIMIVN